MEEIHDGEMGSNDDDSIDLDAVNKTITDAAPAIRRQFFQERFGQIDVIRRDYFKPETAASFLEWLEAKLDSGAIYDLAEEWGIDSGDNPVFMFLRAVCGNYDGPNFVIHPMWTALYLAGRDQLQHEISFVNTITCVRWRDGRYISMAHNVAVFPSNPSDPHQSESIFHHMIGQACVDRRHFLAAEGFDAFHDQSGQEPSILALQALLCLVEDARKAGTIPDEVFSKVMVWLNLLQKHYAMPITEWLKRSAEMKQAAEATVRGTGGWVDG